MREQELSVEQLVAVQRAAAANAETLLLEAKLLLDIGRHARAHALAILAFEELGKHVMTVSALLRRDEPGFWKKYSDRFSSHKEKLRLARLAVQMFGEGDEFEEPGFFHRLNQWVASDSLGKLRGLYVDVGDDGSILEPMSATTPAEAEQLIADVDLVMAAARTMARGNLDAAVGRAAEWGGLERMLSEGLGSFEEWPKEEPGTRPDAGE